MVRLRFESLEIELQGRINEKIWLVRHFEGIKDGECWMTSLVCSLNLGKSNYPTIN